MNSIINDVMEAAKKINKVTANKAEEIYQLSKLKRQYINLSKEIRERYAALGELLCRLRKTGSDESDLLMQSVTEIELSLTRLDDIQNSIDSIQDIISCPKCATKNRSGSFYCNHCGQKLVRGEYEF